VFALSTTGASDIDEIDTAINNISAARADFGAVQNRLEHTVSNLASYQENLTASESRIRDADMAQEMVNFSKLQILQQAGTSMLAQANQAPQSVLSLLH
jgi:flagellin